MKASELRQSILQAAVHGRLVPQDPNDEPALVLLKRIKQEKARLIRDGKIKKDKPLPPINEDETPYDLPEGWSWCRLGEISNIFRGSSPRPKGSPQYWTPKKTEFHWITIQDISNYTYNSYLTNTREYLTELGSTLSTYVGKDKLIIAVSGSTTGKACLTGIDGYIYDGLAAIDIDKNYILPGYLFVFIRFSYQAFNDSKVGSAFPNINTEILKNTVFAVPPLAEQHRIVAKVDELMSMCDELEAAEKELDALEDRFAEYLPKSILQAAVQGKLVEQDSRNEPASELLKRIQKEKARLIKEGKIRKDKSLQEIGEDEFPYVLPDGWVWCRLGDLIELISGRDLEPKQYNDDMHGIPYITGASAIEDDSILINRWTNMPVVVSQCNDILLSCKGTVGKIVLNNIGDCHIARQIMAIRVFSDNLEREYIKLFLHSYVVQLNIKAKSIIPGVSRDNVLLALCPLPPLAEQCRIVAKVDELMALCGELTVARTSVSKVDETKVVPFPQRFVEDEYDSIGMAARGDGTGSMSDKLRQAIDDWDDGDE